MATQSGAFYDESLVCSTSAALTSSQFYIVAFSTATVTQGRMSVKICAGTSFGLAGAVGVLQDAPDKGRAGIVRMLGTGISKVVSTTSATIALGDPVTCNGSGQAMTADTTGQRVIGTCIVASTGGAALIEVLLNGPFSYSL